MLVCPKCGNVLLQDVTYWQCFCGSVLTIKDAVPYTPITPKKHKILNQWVEIHEFLAERIRNNSWNQIEVFDYYNRWVSKIPGCCVDNYLKLVEQFPIDWSTAETAFYSLWYLHNEVSSKHANHPTITLDKAKELYNAYPPLPEKT